MNLQLAGKVALVTGASIGLGRSIATLLAEEGCRLAIVARRVNLLEKVANEIAAAGREPPLIIVEDITVDGAAERIKAQAMARFGSLDILINNAGGSRPLTGLGTEEEWEEAMLLNYTAGRHLISGPLGTIAGVYETAIDALSSRRSGDAMLRPKIVASTATVRRADLQIRALFDRQRVEVFPPPGPDRRDSFFAETESSSKTPARRYVGIAAPGRSLKVVLLRASLALLSAGKTLYEREGGKKNKQNAADPYMTLLGYFNSLRELGGSRRIVEDEVRTRVAQYSKRRRRDPVDNQFSDRAISYDVLELTSRVATNQVASAKRRLALRFYEDERVDVALATNMISVGLDIIRLGLRGGRR